MTEMFLYDMTEYNRSTTREQSLKIDDLTQ